MNQPSTIARASYPFSGRTVIVTGAGTGIGQTIAQAFLEQQANVVVVGRTLRTLESTLDGADPTRSLAVAADIATPEGSAAAVEAALERFGRIDVLVLNAGVFVPGEIDETSLDEWHEMMKTNVDAVFLNIRDALPALEATKGNIVAISSVSGIRGDWRQSAYNATKGAVNVMVKSLALDLGARGVRINAVAPAYTLTRMAPFQTPETLAPYVNRFPLGRVGETEDIARAVLFVASEDAGFITGVVLPVDGGLTASTGHPHLG